MLLLLLALLFQSPGSAGVELNPSDPQGTNYQKILACMNVTPWLWNGKPSGGCRVFYTPGSYYLQKPINIPNGVTDVYLKGVTLYPCTAMSSVIISSTLGPAPGAILHDFVAAPDKPCGTYIPPMPIPTRWL